MGFIGKSGSSWILQTLLQKDLETLPPCLEGIQRVFFKWFLFVCLFACLFLMIKHTDFESIKLAHTVGIFCKCLLGGARHCPRLRYSDEECFFILDLHLSVAC